LPNSAGAGPIRSSFAIIWLPRFIPNFVSNCPVLRWFRSSTSSAQSRWITRTSATCHVDALLLDSGNPKLKIKELGGTGRIHDWRLSRRIRDSISIPLFLAGGLHAGTLDEAIATAQPFGLDLCSGVRTNDVLDDLKLEALFAAAADESR
jgi:phosphoribosylanthranilate isomerase